MKIIMRGDCCCRRAVAFNADLFGGRPRIVKDEKSRTDFFLDHLVHGSPSEDDVRRYLDVERMGKSLRAYTFDQTHRDTLDVRDADLIMFDNYADMNFKAWRHREQGWKLWIHPAFLVDRERFEEKFENVDYLAFDEAVDLQVRLIEHYREHNGDLPVLSMCQPIAYYSKLDDRAEFRRLARAVAERLEGVFVADVPEEMLEPNDMGSCGPGQTLHFTGATYRAMIENAIEEGMSQWLPPTATTLA